MPLPPVNYSQTLNDLATNFTKATIVSISWYWPASTRLYKVKRQQNYPSWAPDFTALPQLGILSAMDLEGMHFRGSATRYSALIQDERFNRAPPHQLPLKGLCIGTVASLSTQYLQHLLLTQRDGGVGALEHDIDAWTICLNFSSISDSTWMLERQEARHYHTHLKHIGTYAKFLKAPDPNGIRWARSNSYSHLA